MQQIEIRIKGHLAPNWSDWFGGLSIHLTADGQTILSGLVADQSALYGLIEKLSNLGLQLQSVAVSHTAKEVGHV